MSEESPRPARRKRYSGKNPRKFEDKYKEHDPVRYGETVAKVIASGKTPAGSHLPIMVRESMEVLDLRPGMVGVDATVGHGGHALKILEKISPSGFLLGFDVDPIEQPKTEARILAAGFGPNVFTAIRSNFAGLKKVLQARGQTTVDFVFADLGCSSMQFDDPARGFSFKHPGPLDMRMNPNRGISAAEWIHKISPEKFEAAIQLNSDEPRAASIAEALAGKRFEQTTEFAQAIRSSIRESDPESCELTVRRVFQAVRISVNEEFAALEAFLRCLPECLVAGGRAAFLTFHSGEDRRVKLALREGLRDGIFKSISETPIRASSEERRLNPRSASAKLRWLEMKSHG